MVFKAKLTYLHSYYNLDISIIMDRDIREEGGREGEGREGERERENEFALIEFGFFSVFVLPWAKLT